MSENYPMGADNDKSAPWNRERNPLVPRNRLTLHALYGAGQPDIN